MNISIKNKSLRVVIGYFMNKEYFCICFIHKLNLYNSEYA